MCVVKILLTTSFGFEVRSPMAPLGMANNVIVVLDMSSPVKPVFIRRSLKLLKSGCWPRIFATSTAEEREAERRRKEQRTGIIERFIFAGIIVQVKGKKDR